MKDEKKKFKYTFEDWRQGRIKEYDLPPGLIPNALKMRIGMMGFWDPDYADLESKKRRDKEVIQQLKEQTESSLIDPEELRKIVDAQEEAFFIAVDHNVQRIISKIEQKRKNATYPDEYLQHELDDYKSIIENAPRDTLKDVKAGRFSPTGIGWEKYYEIMKLPENTQYPAISLSGIKYKNKRFHFTVAWEVKNKLESIVDGFEGEKDEPADRELHKSQEEIYKAILETNEGILAGKMAFFRKVKEDGSFRNNPRVFDKADEIHRKIMGNRFYANVETFESSQTQFLKKPGSQKTLKKILKPFSRS